MVLLDDLQTQETMFQQWLEIAVSAADDATAHGHPSTTLVAELTAAFDRTVAKLINKLKLSPGSHLNHGGLFDSVFGLVRKGETASLVVAKHFAPSGKAAATALHRALDLLDFIHGGGLNLPYAANAHVSAISATEESGVAIDTALTLARIEAKIAISPSEMVPLVTEAGTSTLWAV
jgi:N-acetylglucosamine kinase-like BadF-type ATPase